MILEKNMQSENRINRGEYHCWGEGFFLLTCLEFVMLFYVCMYCFDWLITRNANFGISMLQELESS